MDQDYVTVVLLQMTYIYACSMLYPTDDNLLLCDVLLLGWAYLILSQWALLLVNT